jgi:uncharacterized membrane protein YeaQ/YmgE (transglycosylase-associated protein family)
LSDFNPYRAPDAATPRGKHPLDEGIWREGKFLLMTKRALLPDRCVKCDEPADGYRLKRNLSWHPQVYYLLVLLHLIIYLIVALIVRKQAKILVPLCPRHRSGRYRDILIGWVGSLAGIALIIASIASQDSWPQEMRWAGGLGGSVLLLASLIYGSVRARIVVPKRIDESTVLLKGVCRAFLARFPDAGAPAKLDWDGPARPPATPLDKLDVVEDFREL